MEPSARRTRPWLPCYLILQNMANKDQLSRYCRINLRVDWNDWKHGRFPSDQRSINSSSSGRSQSKISSSESCKSFVVKFMAEYRVLCIDCFVGSLQNDSGSLRFLRGVCAEEKVENEFFICSLGSLIIEFPQFFSLFSRPFLLRTTLFSSIAWTFSARFSNALSFPADFELIFLSLTSCSLISQEFAHDPVNVTPRPFSWRWRYFLWFTLLFGLTGFCRANLRLLVAVLTKLSNELAVDEMSPSSKFIFDSLLQSSFRSTIATVYVRLNSRFVIKQTLAFYIFLCNISKAVVRQV